MQSIARRNATWQAARGIQPCAGCTVSAQRLARSGLTADPRNRTTLDAVKNEIARLRAAG